MTPGVRASKATACLFDYAPGPSSRPALRCVAHPKCPREVTLWRDGLLEELAAAGRLVGAALAAV